jgi:hypothetical protein
MSLKGLLERHRDCKEFRHILYRLWLGGFRSYKYADKKLSEADSILERLRGKISDKKIKTMKASLCAIGNDFEYVWLSGYFG